MPCVRIATGTWGLGIEKALIESRPLCCTPAMSQRCQIRK